VACVDRIISSSRVANLVEGFHRSPAYAGLAEALRVLIGDGRITLDTRLPSERDLAEALGVSRTTATRAYALVVEQGYAEARRGAGTFTRLPGRRAQTRAQTLDRVLLPGPDDADALDLNCAAPSSPPGLARAYEDAAAELPAYFSGHGYFPAGLPRLQQAIAASYETRGLPTSPDQILVTAGALSATAIAAQALTGPGDRVLVESPGYPNATLAIKSAGARLVPSAVDPDGWDLDAVVATVRAAAPRVAYVIPDFHNPTGALMGDEDRERYAAALRQTRTVAVVDESHVLLALEGQQMPRPFAAYADGAISVGSSSKAFWGGLRLGWLRAPAALLERVTRARLGLDLGSPVLEQLVLAHLLEDPTAVLESRRAGLREQRDALAAAVRERLPDWRFRLPEGGLALWCELPESLGTCVTTDAERRGVIVAPGPVFAPEGGLDRFVRIPFTRPVADLERAVDVLADAWAPIRSGERPTPRGTGRVMVA
jgi:DNA-binding transcriptional MocR family regulator